MLIVLCWLMVIMRVVDSLKSAIPLAKHNGWLNKALEHREVMMNLLYPAKKDASVSLRERKHSVNAHPIYNFLHTYYRYSADSLLKYSPGLNVHLLDVQDEDIKGHGKHQPGVLHPRFWERDEDHTLRYSPDCEELLSDVKKVSSWQRNMDVLTRSAARSPVFSCYGAHEWAMLYRGNDKKQPQLNMRVSQSVIDKLVETLPLRCTHYDAFRFFDKEAQPLNAVQLPTRDAQIEREQPACIHATMDLFKYAYQLYPLCSAKLLRDSVEIATRARIIDMRASPYDVSAFEGCADAICIETEEGRMAYAREQEGLMQDSLPLRRELLAAYQAALTPYL